jgi:hypothetical protein
MGDIMKNVSEKHCNTPNLYERTLDESDARSAADPGLVLRQYETPDAVDTRFEVYGHAVDPRSVVFRGLRKAMDILRLSRPAEQIVAADIGGSNGRFGRRLLMKEARRVDVIDPGVDENSADMLGYAVDEIFAEERPGIVAYPSMAEEVDMQPGKYDLMTMLFMLYHVEEPKKLLAKAADWLKDDGVLMVATSGLENKTLQHDRIQPLIAKYLTAHYNADKREGDPDAITVRPPVRFNQSFVLEDSYEVVNEVFDVVDWCLQDTVVEYGPKNLQVLRDSIGTMQPEFSRVPTKAELRWATNRALVEVILGKTATEAGMDTEEAVEGFLANGDWKLTETVVRGVLICVQKEKRSREAETDLDRELEQLELVPA